MVHEDRIDPTRAEELDRVFGRADDDRYHPEPFELMTCELLVDLVVLDDEHRRLLCAGDRSLVDNPNLVPVVSERFGRDLEHECRAAADAALHRDGAVQHRQDTVRDRQAEPGAAVTHHRRRGVERLEDAVEVARRDAGAGIGDLDRQAGVTCGRLTHGYRYVDPAALGELDRVLDEIPHELMQPGPVRRDERRYVGVDDRRDGDRSIPDGRSGERHDVVDDVADMRRPDAGLGHSELETGVLEQVVGHPRHLGDLTMQGGRDRSRHLAEGLVGCQQLGQARQRVEGVSEFVADRGDQPRSTIGLGDRLVPESAQLVAGPPFLGHVARRDHDAANIRIVQQVHGGRLENLLASCCVDDAYIGRDHRVGLAHDRVAQLQHLRRVLREEDIEDGASVPELARVAEGRPVSPGCLDHGPVLIHERDRAGTVLEQFADPRVVDHLAPLRRRNVSHQSDTLVAAADRPHHDPSVEVGSVTTNEPLDGSELVVDALDEPGDVRGEPRPILLPCDHADVHVVGGGPAEELGERVVGVAQPAGSVGDRDRSADPVDAEQNEVVVAGHRAIVHIGEASGEP